MSRSNSGIMCFMHSRARPLSISFSLPLSLSLSLSMNLHNAITRKSRITLSGFAFVLLR